MSTTSLLGRELAIDEVAGLVARSGARLVTLTGPGGVGKTRLAVAVGERLRDRFGAGTVFVPLDAVTDPGLVLVAVGRMAGTDLGRAGSPLEALAETFGDGAWLLILDNLERAAQLKGAAEGLRQRVGLPAWPDLRRLEEELVDQIRQKLSAAQFDQAFSAGSELTQRQAIDIVRDQRGTAPRRS